MSGIAAMLLCEIPRDLAKAPRTHSDYPLAAWVHWKDRRGAVQAAGTVERCLLSICQL